MTLVVVVADKMDTVGLDEIRESDGFEVVSVVGDADALQREIPRADALLVRSATQVTEALMSRAPKLKVIGRAGIGVDNIDVEAATRRGIAVVNAPGANTVSAAEHTIALLLSLVRRIPEAVQSMRQGEWDRSRFGGTELRGKTMGLVGLGRIGAHVSGIAQAFGMKVLAFDPFLSPERARKMRVELVPLDPLLRVSDVVSLHAPMTDETRHLLDRERLAMMKPTAVIVNAARGGLIDAEALVEAVESGRLAGAALDVFDPEPLPPDSPLRSCERIIVTPHLAATTDEAQTRVSGEICSTVLRVLQTGDIGGAVNVAGVSNEVVSRARHEIDLARHLGRLVGSILGGAPVSLEVLYAGSDEEAAKPVMLGAVEGLLQAMGIRPVSLVNATMLAEERGIKLGRRIRPAPSKDEMTIGVKAKSIERSASVTGMLGGGGNGRGRIIRIDDYDVDIPAEGSMVILRNQDVPGVIGQVGTVLGEASINIAYYHQSRSATRNGVALAAIAVDQKPSRPVLGALEAVPDVVEVRFANLDPPDGPRPG